MISIGLGCPTSTTPENRGPATYIPNSEYYEYGIFFDDSQEVSRPSPDNSSCCDGESTALDSPPPTAAKNSGKAKKAEQARRATEKVSRGEVLMRAAIGALTKAEARAFLSAIPKNAAAARGVRGNLSDLQAHLRSVFDERLIDTWKAGGP